jgi:hypothetical protein
MSFGKLGALGLGFGRMGASGKSHGGPFLLLFDGVSKLLLQNATDRLLITGSDPAAATSGQPMGLLLALTYP